MSAPTLGDSIAVLARYGYVRSPYYRMETERRSETFILRIIETIEFGDEVRLPLERFAGDNVELRFCVALPPSAPSDASYTLAGFVEPRVVRMAKSER